MQREYYGIVIDDRYDENLTEDAHSTLRQFYSIKEEGESTQEVLARAAISWSTFNGVTDYELAQRVYLYSAKRWWSWSSPCLSNGPSLRTKKVRGMPISCFLGYVGDSIDELVDHSTEVKYLSVNGGGTSGHWGAVRSPDEKSPGMSPFLAEYDRTMQAYRQGRTRKGSYASWLPVTHPEILEFIRMRVPTGDGDVNRKNLNLHHGVNLSDEFMRAVEEDREYQLIDPKYGFTNRWLKARMVWELILETRHRTGEPFMVFIDTAMRGLNPIQRAIGRMINGSNLCTEIFLATDSQRTAVCCLASPNAEFYEEWCQTTMIRDMARCLDNVLEFFIQNAPKQLNRAVHSARTERSIGIGLMGFAYHLQRNRIPFESEEALQRSAEIMSHISSEASIESEQLAIERGEPDDIRGSGMRNAHLMAIAPNATSAQLVVTSPSTEMPAANVYTQLTKKGPVLHQNRYLAEWLEELGLNEPDVWDRIAQADGSIRGMGDILPAEMLEVFPTEEECDPVWVIAHAATRQVFLDQGQSVNLRFPSNADREYLNYVHMLAWRSGLKSLYYLRTRAPASAENVESDVSGSVGTLLRYGVVVYGKPGCPQCESTKALLRSRGVEYRYFDVIQNGIDIREATGNPQIRSLPVVMAGGNLIGGLNETRQWLASGISEQETLVESVANDDTPGVVATTTAFTYDTEGCKACEA